MLELSLSVITQLSVPTCFIITSDASIVINKLNVSIMNYSDVTFGYSAEYSIYELNARTKCEVIAQAALVPEFETMTVNDIIAIDESQWHIFETSVIRHVSEIADIFVPANVYGADVNKAREYYIKDALLLAFRHAYNRSEYANTPIKSILLVMIDKLILRQQIVIDSMQEIKKRYKRMSIVFDD